MLEQAAVDPGAFALLYDRYYSRIYNYIRYRCEDSDTADDLTSQVFERLLKKIKQYSPARGLFEPWLFAIVRNIVTDHHRSPRKREVPWDDLQQNPTADPSPESQVIRLENMTELLRALERLDERFARPAWFEICCRADQPPDCRVDQNKREQRGCDPVPGGCPASPTVTGKPRWGVNREEAVMNSPKIEERFSRDVDDLLQTGSLPDGEAVPEQYLEMLQLADRLSKIDPSQSSKVRLPLRTCLIERAERELPASSARRAWGGRMALAGKWTLGVAALAAIILGLIWVFSNLVPSLRHQPAAASTLVPASTLAPIPAELPLPTPSPLSLDTPIEEIVGRMSSPLWNTLWLSGVALTEELAGQPQISLVQAWIDRDGRGRVLSSDPLLGEVIDPAAALPRYAWISDGSRYALYDLQTGQPGPTSGLYGWAGHALENAGPFMELVFPYYIAGRGGAFQAVGQDTLAGRPVLVVGWRPDETSPLQDRFWVDTETGQILRRQTLLQDEVTVVKDLHVDSVMYDAAFPQNLAGVADVLQPRGPGQLSFRQQSPGCFRPI